jgi:autotransporter-associated beta strand protein
MKLKMSPLLVTCALVLSSQLASADSATWNLNPISGDWNTTANWDPPTVPNGPADTATFDVSNMTEVFLSGTTEVNAINFDSGASAFQVTMENNLSLTFSGTGITNNSSIIQDFVATGDVYSTAIQFFNNATAGDLTRFTVNDARSISFFNSSTAGTGRFIFNGTAQSVSPGLFFYDSSNASNGTFTFRPNARLSGECEFFGNSTAGNSFFTVNGGLAGSSFLGFFENSSADHATLIATAGINGGNGGSILFGDDSTGDAPRVIVLGYGGSTGQSEGSLVIQHNPPGVTIGSLEGNGLVDLTDFSSPNLIIGSNNRSTTFSGMIHGGLGNSSRPSITKIGKGTLTLTNSNDYTGGTIVTDGTVLVTNTTGTATGRGNVAVNGGDLGGTGTIQGHTRVGDGIGSNASLSPGVSGVGTITFRKTLTFQLDGSYDWELNSDSATADKIVAKGVTINSGAVFSFIDLGTGTLPPGTVFSAISNTSATPISGTFANLPDDSTFIIGNNTFQVSYEGGDGNDLTLTVMPEQGAALVEAYHVRLVSKGNASGQLLLRWYEAPERR